MLSTKCFLKKKSDTNLVYKKVHKIKCRFRSFAKGRKNYLYSAF